MIYEYSFFWVHILFACIFCLFTMSSLNCCFLRNSLNTQTPISSFNPNNRKSHLGHTHFSGISKSSSSSSSSFPKFKCQIHVGFEDIVTITQNKVLIAAGVSGAIGQLAKPFTSVVLYGKSFDLRAVVQAGGFPSTHSSAVVAAATCLALERGFSDSIFGMSLVYACLVMYDAQGVRREVGIHAKTLNRLLLKDQMKSMMKDSEDIAPETSSAVNFNSSHFLEEPNAFSEEQKASTQLIGSRLQKSMPEKNERCISYVPLKESIGHTEIEVIAGALLGFFVSVAVCAVM